MSTTICNDEMGQSPPPPPPSLPPPPPTFISRRSSSVNNQHQSNAGENNEQWLSTQYVANANKAQQQLVQRTKSPCHTKSIQAISRHAKAVPSQAMYDKSVVLHKHNGSTNNNCSSEVTIKVKSTANKDIVVKRLRKEAFEAFAQCSSDKEHLTVDEFGLFLEQMCIVQAHGGTVVADLVKRAYELVAMMQQQSSSNTLATEEDKGLAVSAVTGFLEILYGNQSDLPEESKFTALVEDLKIRKVMNACPPFLSRNLGGEEAAKVTTQDFHARPLPKSTYVAHELAPTPQSLLSVPDLVPLSCTREFYKRRFEDIKAEKEIAEEKSCTFQPKIFTKRSAATDVSFQPDGSSSSSSSSSSTSFVSNTSAVLTTTRRVKDRRPTIMRELDECTFHPAITKESAFVSERYIREQSTIQGGVEKSVSAASSYTAKKVRSARKKPEPPSNNENKRQSAASSNDFSTLNQMRGTFVQGEGFFPNRVPVLGANLFFFDPVNPPSFPGGTHLLYNKGSALLGNIAMSDDDDEEQEVEAECDKFVVERHNTSGDETRDSFGSDVPTAPSLALLATPALEAQAPFVSKVLFENTSTKKSAAAATETPQANKGGGGGGGWQAVLDEMARRSSTVGTDTMLKKTEKKSVGRLKGRGGSEARSAKRRGGGQFTNVIDELSHRLAEMKAENEREDRGQASIGSETKRSSSSKRKGSSNNSSRSPSISPTEKRRVAPVVLASSPTAPLQKKINAQKQQQQQQQPVQHLQQQAELFAKEAVARPLQSQVPQPPPIHALWPLPFHPAATSNKMTGSLAGRLFDQNVQKAQPTTALLRQAKKKSKLSCVTLAPLPSGFYLPFSEAHLGVASRPSPGSIQAAGSITQAFIDEFVSKTRVNATSNNKEDTASSASEANTGEREEINADLLVEVPAKITSADLPLPASYYGAINRLHRAQEVRAAAKDREQSLEWRYYGDPNNFSNAERIEKASALEPTVIKEFIFASTKRLENKHFTHRKPQERSANRHLPLSYHMSEKSLVQPFGDNLTSCHFASLLRQPNEPVPLLDVEVAEKKLKQANDRRIFINEKRQYSRDLREKREAEKEKEQARKIKAHKETLRQKAQQTAEIVNGGVLPRRNYPYEKLLERYASQAPESNLLYNALSLPPPPPDSPEDDRVDTPPRALYMAYR